MESFEPTFDEAGETAGVSITVVDITAHKMAGQALRESEDHFRSFVNLSPHAPWVADPDGKIIDASPRWNQMTGMTREESLGYGWLKAVHPDDVDRRMAALAQSIETGVPTDIKYRLRFADGSYRWVRSRAWPRFGDNGEIIRWYGCLEDVEESRHTADRLVLMIKSNATCPHKQGCRFDQHYSAWMLSSQLEKVLWQHKYGEERRSRTVARAIARAEATETIVNGAPPSNEHRVFPQVDPPVNQDCATIVASPIRAVEQTEAGQGIEATRRARGPAYRPGLDALRFIAFLLVFIHHAFVRNPSSGSTLHRQMQCVITNAAGFGLQLFFVLSAFLICDILLREREATGQVRIGAFYMRRALRI